MIVSVKAKNVSISGQKVGFILNSIKKMTVDKALDILNFSNKKASFIIKKILKSAVSNAEHNHGLDIDELVIDSAYVNNATSLKRFKARAKGRSNKIIKRHCHIIINVKERK